MNDADPAAARIVGRRAELDALDAVLNRARAARGSTLVLHGDAGIGKSALLAEAGARAHERAMTVLRANGVRSEMDLPYGGIHQLLHPLLGGGSEQAEALLQQLTAEPGETPRDRFAVALAALELVSATAQERPLVLIADDLHWFDRSTTDALAFIGRRLHEEPVALIGAVRDEYRDQAAAAGLPMLHVGALDGDAAAELLERSGTDLSRPAKDRLLAIAGGNPLALTELPRASIDAAEVPPVGATPISDLLEQRFAAGVSRLPRPTQLLLLAAAADSSAPFGYLAAAASRVMGSTVDERHLQPAIDATMVRVDGGCIVFRHPLITSAIYQAAPFADRRAIHRALADIASGDRALWHRAEAAVDGDTTIAAELADLAERSVLRGAAGIGVRALRRAATLSPEGAGRSRLLLRAAELEGNLGHFEAAVELLHDTDLAVLGLEGRARAAIIRGLADFVTLADDRVLPELLAITRELQEAGQIEMAAGALWTAATYSWRVSADAARRAELVTLARGMGMGEHPMVLAVVACAAPADAGIEGPVAALAPAPGDMATLSLAACAAHTLADHATAARHATLATRALRSHGQPGVACQLAHLDAWARLWIGDLAGAASASAEAEELASDSSDTNWVTLARVQGALIRALHTGEAGPAESLVEQASADPVVARDRGCLAAWRKALALVTLSVGDFDAAFDHAARVLTPRDPAHHHAIQTWVLGDLAEAARGSGRTAQAAAILEPLFASLTAAAPSAVLANAAYARLALADDDTFEDRLAAMREFDLTRRPLDRARLALAEGQHLRHVGDVTAARAPLTMARDLFGRIGAAGWVATATRELLYTGAAPDVDATERVGELTPQEWQVARMAAAGLTNRQIGRQLFISHRTVGSHLYHLFPKLGISTRAQLFEALREYDDRLAPR